MKVLSSAQNEEFNKEGYLILRGCLTPKEVEFLFKASQKGFDGVSFNEKKSDVSLK